MSWTAWGELAQSMSQRLQWASLVLLAYVGLCAAAAWRHARRQRPHRIRHRQGQGPAQAVTAGAAAETDWTVLYASQGGQAEALARLSARALQDAGLATQVLPLQAWAGPGLPTATATSGATRLLFVVSTHGEGDPPEHAQAFVRRHLHAAAGGAPPRPLVGVQYGLLALGDRDYPRFCAFGRRLDAWLGAQGAVALFARIEVHRGDPQALQAWREQLGHLTTGTTGSAQVAGGAGVANLSMPSEAPPFEPWRLVARRCLNPGSPGQPAYQLRLVPPPGVQPDWQAGDLVQVLPPGAAGGRPRDYTVANVPGLAGTPVQLELLVRQHAHAPAPSMGVNEGVGVSVGVGVGVGTEGVLGTVSGWLTARAREGDLVWLRLRAHPAFRIAGNAERPLILIGNGTGLAGLRAHLQARAQALRGDVPPPRCAWLLFGERSRAHDQFHADELAAWQACGVLSHVDRVFSREGEPERYVQQRLLACAPQLREWVDAGAAIYVCGSRRGMASGVDAALCRVLGDAEVAALAQAGRLRRDVY